MKCRHALKKCGTHCKNLNTNTHFVGYTPRNIPNRENKKIQAEGRVSAEKYTTTCFWLVIGDD